MVPMHDWAAEGIVETVESFTLSDGSTVNYVTYYGDGLDVTDTSSKVPLVLIFHGGGNTALYHAQASEWPLIGKGVRLYHGGCRPPLSQYHRRTDGGTVGSSEE